LAPHPHPYPFPMDREAGIRAFESLVSAGEYRRRIAAGDERHIHRYVNADGQGDASPVIQAVVKRIEVMSGTISKYVFAALDGKPLPVWSAGAHIDVLVAPGMMRQYSMSGDPANRDVYEVAVLREDEGRGGSLLMHRIFTEGRRVFISRPINHFELQENAARSFLMGGGIGVTPMIAFGHTLHAQGRDFTLHYSASTSDDLAFGRDLRSFGWAGHVVEHVSSQGGRADLDVIFAGASADDHVYVCGPETYMAAVLAAAAHAGLPDEHLHREYFSVPEQPDYENYVFDLLLRRSGRRIRVEADETASDALVANGYPVDVKCADGLCGVCKCGVLSGDVEHRDFVLSDRQRADSMILCQSRAADEGGVIELDL
ncbi:MAG: PDR/VanB family oxidoreductase, partial [Candidatus Puniceispirillaceae bacterium]